MEGIFHIAFASQNIKKAKAFYTEILECTIGREATNWIDINFFGHQMSIHKVSRFKGQPENYLNPITNIPANHFGVILNWESWHILKEKLREKSIEFLIAPQMAFPGEEGEQKTLFIKDPDGNAIEFKSFQNQENIFKHTQKSRPAGKFSYALKSI